MTDVRNVSKRLPRMQRNSQAARDQTLFNSEAWHHFVEFKHHSLLLQSVLHSPSCSQELPGIRSHVKLWKSLYTSLRPAPLWAPVSCAI